MQYKNSQIIMGGLIRSYTYDGFNRRVKTNSNEFSAYSQEGQLLFRQEGSIATQYMYLGSRLVAKKKSQTVSYLHTDILGSVIAETNGSKTVQSRSHYKAFGDTVAAPQDDVGYTGHKFDADLGLSYMQARYYDPVIGRFYSNDPVGYTAKNPVMSFNRYMYVNNNPYKYTDPNGEFLNFAIGAIVGGIAEAASQAIAGKGFDGGKIAASMVLGGVTSGLSLVASAGKTLSIGSKVFNGSLSATGAAGESMIHDSLDGNVADLGKALTSAVTSVPLIGNASTLGKMTKDSVQSKMVAEGANETVADLTSGAAGAVVGSGVKGAENWAKEQDKQNE